MSMAVRSGICHCPSASIRNPSRRASKSSVMSRTCFTSSRDSINMRLFSLSFLLLNSFDDACCYVRIGLHQNHVDALKWVDNEIRYQTEFVILPLSRLNFERLVKVRVDV